MLEQIHRFAIVSYGAPTAEANREHRQPAARRVFCCLDVGATDGDGLMADDNQRAPESSIERVAGMLDEIETATAIFDRENGSVMADRDMRLDHDAAEVAADEAQLDEMLVERRIDELEDAGYVAIGKSFLNRKPLTRIRLTEAGRKAFAQYLDAIAKLVEEKRLSQLPNG